MTPAWMEKLEAFRAYVFEAIRKSLEEDGHCKSYEGAVAIHWPNYFEQDQPQYGVHLSCYLIGPTRGYDWTAPTIEAALDKALHDVRIWCERPHTEWGTTYLATEQQAADEAFRHVLTEMGEFDLDPDFLDGLE
jgi:hypothetical protein